MTQGKTTAIFSETLIKLLKLGGDMASVYDKILSTANACPPGSVFTTKDFIDVANRMSIDKALSSLVKDGKLRRLARGLYDVPKQKSPLGILPPDLDQVIAAITRQSGDTLQIDGAKAANLLGLSTQVPAQLVYLTNGHTRTIKIGKWTIKLKHASPKILAGAGHMAGCVLQALRYLGKHNVDSNIINKLDRTLSNNDKKFLMTLIPFAPSWACGTLQALTRGSCDPSAVQIN